MILQTLITGMEDVDLSISLNGENVQDKTGKFADDETDVTSDEEELDQQDDGM